MSARAQRGNGALNPLYTSQEGAAYSDAFLTMAAIIVLTLAMAYRMRRPWGAG